MIDLYALTSPNVQKIFIMLEECELPYNVKLVDVWKGDQFTSRVHQDQSVAENPGHRRQRRSRGKPYTVIESGAILLYLAEKTGKFIPHDPLKRYDVMQWLMVQMANVGPMCGQHVHFSRFAPPGSDYGVSALPHDGQQGVRRLRRAPVRAALRRRRRLHHRRHRRFSLAAQHRTSSKSTFRKRPHVKAWVDKLNAREAVKRAYGKIAQIKSVRDTATDDAKDRYFGRGKYATA